MTAPDMMCRMLQRLLSIGMSVVVNSKTTPTMNKPA